jgi:long-chain acyl-CoA synthetase
VTSSSLVDLLRRHPAGLDEPLIHTLDGARTTVEVRTAVDAVADSLRAAGLGPGSVVALCLPNDARFVEAMFGVWSVGAAFVPLNPRAPEPERAAALAATHPNALLTVDGLAVLDDGQAVDPGVAFMLWTSGTTGAPKPILHTHAAYLELLDRVLGPLRGVAADPAKRPPPNLIPVSLSANAGIYNVLFGLRAGAAIVLMDRFDPADFATLVRRHGIRSTVLPPAMITMLNDAPELDSLAPLRYVRSITAPLSPLQARRFTDRFGALVLNGYGQAEIGEVIGWTAADAKAHPDKIGAAGRPHPGVEIRLRDPDGPGVGTLLVRPPSMAAGYAAGGELADRIDAEGFVDTGDLARVDADGFVWIEGRAGDLVNRGGNKVFPEQVEEVLRLVPGVVDAAVVGLPDDRLGEVPVACIVTDREVDDAVLDAECRAHLVAYKVPVAYRRVASLPRNDAGKLQRRVVAASIREEGTA